MSRARARFSGIQRVLHWGVAVLVVAMVPAGIVISDFDNRAAVEAVLGPGGFDRLYALHKGTGFVVLGLMLLRLLLRGVLPDPPWLRPLPPVLSVLSRAVQAGLYLLLIAVPLSGWIGVGAYPAPLPVWGLFEMPPLTGPDRALSERLLGLHGLLGLAVGALVLLHVAGALHHLLRRDGVFGRMW